MKIAIVSANLGDYDPQVPWVEQLTRRPDVMFDMVRFTDSTCPPRVKAMTSSLQCGIIKMHMWDFVPGYDAYIWMDASRGMLRPDTAEWFTSKLGSAELLLFLHPERRTIREEYDFIKTRMARPGERYLTGRYRGEWLDEQYAAVNVPWHTDNVLYASTAFMCRPTLRVKDMMRAWFYHKARYLLHDQLALPFVAREHRVHVATASDSVYDCVHMPMTRTKR